jgi:GH18 family chitinase
MVAGTGRVVLLAFWSMENPAEVFAKGIYINVRGLAGASVWDLSADSNNTLTAALTAGLGRSDGR